MENTTIIAILAILVLICLIYGVKLLWAGYEDDNEIEECIEKVIEEKTGINVDLTPSSSEDKV